MGSYWRDKKILITGADGFIGSNLTKSLILKKAKIITYSRKGIKPKSLLSLEGYKKRIFKEEKGSVADFNRLESVVRKDKIEIVFHLAAQSLVEGGHEGPRKTFEINVKGTWNMLEASRINNVKKIIVTSTTHVYGDNPNPPYKEDFYIKSSRPYETSKVCADLIAQSYAATYHMFVGIPRFVNLYGPGDLNFNRLVPKVIKSILKEDNPQVWSGKVMRDFMYIDDAVGAYLALTEADYSNVRDNPIYNFGSGKVISIFDLAEKMVKISKRKDLKVEKSLMPEEREGEVLKQYVSLRKARNKLGWKPKTSLEEGIRKTLNWYKKYFAGIKNI